MLGVAIFVVVFVGFFVLRAIAATITFYFLLPDGDNCPLCDTPTLRVESPGWNRWMPWFRTSWCYACGWEGLLRPTRPASSGVVHEPGARPIGSRREQRRGW